MRGLRAGWWSSCRWISVWVCVALAVLVFGVPVRGHERHAGAGTTDSSASGTAARGIPDQARRQEPVQPYRMPRLAQAALEHVHNKVVHFPIALSVVALPMLLLAPRRPELRRAAVGLVWVAAVAAVGAYFTGRAQADAFQGEPKEWLVELHENLGTAAAAGLVLWAALATWLPARRWAWLWGIPATGLVLVAAFFGGLVAHG